jgi:hypothetical protein
MVRAQGVPCSLLRPRASHRVTRFASSDEAQLQKCTHAHARHQQTATVPRLSLAPGRIGRTGAIRTLLRHGSSLRNGGSGPSMRPGFTLSKGSDGTAGQEHPVHSAPCSLRARTARQRLALPAHARPVSALLCPRAPRQSARARHSRLAGSSCASAAAGPGKPRQGRVHATANPPTGVPGRAARPRAGNRPAGRAGPGTAGSA